MTGGKTRYAPPPSGPAGEQAWLAAAALHFAERANDAEGELMLASLTQQAIAAWRLREATLWQRVKYRARLIRARRARRVGTCRPTLA